MGPSKLILLLISGAWHNLKSYSKFTNALKPNGYEVHVPRLPSMNGATPSNADLTTDTEFIPSYVVSLASASRAIALIMHSYDGQVRTNAVHGLD
ncbi:hypothetical protein BDV40DRAFT_207522 [Aspergillus tamarii]|uniref:AB hydrolase-1 domain-containing protein n=1 Tax=Aspergillus tamarii TaxID=41984 RepID=A0A5N6V7S0_ASPTM|nr:hypothetical protein BDV40DRAFT_207522 [Aspergillus tamarii]